MKTPIPREIRNSNEAAVKALVARFDAAFPTTSSRDYWLAMYASLRGEGDTHREAINTIESEMSR